MLVSAQHDVQVPNEVAGPTVPHRRHTGRYPSSTPTSEAYILSESNNDEKKRGAQLSLIEKGYA